MRFSYRLRWTWTGLDLIETDRTYYRDISRQTKFNKHEAIFAPNVACAEPLLYIGRNHNNGRWFEATVWQDI